MRGAAAAAVAFALVLCGHTAHAQRGAIRLGILGHPGTVSIDSLATVVEINASPAATYRAVERLFDELKVTADVRDSTQGVIGASNVSSMRRFANTRISEFLNCGRGMTGLNADSWRVYITVYAFVTPKDSTHSTLRIAMVGGARDIAGSSTDPVPCGTTGKFEELVRSRVVAMVDG